MTHRGRVPRGRLPGGVLRPLARGPARRVPPGNAGVRPGRGAAAHHDRGGGGLYTFNLVDCLLIEHPVHIVP
jgi:hypothetical protein